MQDGPLGHVRRPSFPLIDRLGELCTSGRDSAAYLWQVPMDQNVRAEIARKNKGLRAILQCKKHVKLNVKH